MQNIFALIPFLIAINGYCQNYIGINLNTISIYKQDQVTTYSSAQWDPRTDDLSRNQFGIDLYYQGEKDSTAIFNLRGGLHFNYTIKRGNSRVPYSDGYAQINDLQETIGTSGYFGLIKVFQSSSLKFNVGPSIHLGVQFHPKHRQTIDYEETSTFNGYTIEDAELPLEVSGGLGLISGLTLPITNSFYVTNEVFTGFDGTYYNGVIEVNNTRYNENNKLISQEENLVNEEKFMLNSFFRISLGFRYNLN